MTSPPRLRMFAGQNGSGKSTLKTVLPTELLGVWLNADEIEAEIRVRGYLDVKDFGVDTNVDVDQAMIRFIQQSAFLASQGFTEATKRISASGDVIDFSQVEVNLTIGWPKSRTDKPWKSKQANFPLGSRTRCCRKSRANDNESSTETDSAKLQLQIKQSQRFHSPALLPRRVHHERSQSRRDWESLLA